MICPANGILLPVFLTAKKLFYFFYFFYVFAISVHSEFTPVVLRQNNNRHNTKGWDKPHPSIFSGNMLDLRYWLDLMNLH